MGKFRVSVGVVSLYVLSQCSISAATLINDFKYIRGMLNQVNGFDALPPGAPCPPAQDQPKRFQQSAPEYKKSREFFENSDVFEKFRGLDNVYQHKTAGRLIVFNDELNEYWIIDDVEKDKVFVDRKNKKILIPNRDRNYPARRIEFLLDESTSHFFLIEIVKGIVTVPVNAIVELLSPSEKLVLTHKLMRPLMDAIGENYSPGMTKEQVFAMMDRRISEMSESELLEMKKKIVDSLTFAADSEFRRSKSRYSKAEFDFKGTRAKIEKDFPPKVIKELLKRTAKRYRDDPELVTLKVWEPNKRSIVGREPFMMLDGFGYDGAYLGRLNPRWYRATNSSSTEFAGGFLGGDVTTRRWQVTEEIPGVTERSTGFIKTAVKNFQFIDAKREKLMIEYSNGGLVVYDMTQDTLAYGSDSATLVFQGNDSADFGASQNGPTVRELEGGLKYLTMGTIHVDDVILNPETLETRTSPDHIEVDAPLSLSADQRYLFTGFSWANPNLGTDRNVFTISDMSKPTPERRSVRLPRDETVIDFKWVGNGIGALLSEYKGEDGKTRRKLSLRTFENPKESKLEVDVESRGKELVYDPKTGRLKIIERNLFGWEAGHQDVIFDGDEFRVIPMPKKEDKEKN